MRDYTNLEFYLNILQGDIYDQPPDEGHQMWAENIVNQWLPNLQNLDSILDVGCGQGQMFPLLQQYASRVEGVTLGNDAATCKAKGLRVSSQDMTFLDYKDSSFDLLFARHVLEHSPMPLLTLMEWHRVSKQWLVLIVPDLDHFGPSGRNHYYVLRPDQWANLLERSGWGIVWTNQTKDIPEYRWLCEKRKVEWDETTLSSA